MFLLVVTPVAETWNDYSTGQDVSNSCCHAATYHVRDSETYLKTALTLPATTLSQPETYLIIAFQAFAARIPGAERGGVRPTFLVTVVTICHQMLKTSPCPTSLTTEGI